MVQDWVSNQGSNYGMLVNSDPIAGSNSNRFFSATEYENSDQRPKLVITYSVGEDEDTTPPTVSITSPISGGTYYTEATTIDLTGTASDNKGVTSVTWTNSQGGNGIASGTTDWTISDIPLHCGDNNNVITITAKDAANNAASTTLTIDVNPCPVKGLGL